MRRVVISLLLAVEAKPELLDLSTLPESPNLDCAAVDTEPEPSVTSRSRGIRGLGLTISRDLVAAHEGTIELRSEVGAGTTVLVTVPA